jgi:hypothetical protein
MDAKAIEYAEAIAREVRSGYDAEALLGTLVPVLIALCVEYLGSEFVQAQLRKILSELKRD